MIDLTIRRAALDDASDLSKLICDNAKKLLRPHYSSLQWSAFLEYYSPEAIRDKIKDQVIYCALNCGQIVGCVGLDKNRVVGFYTRLGFQSMGIGGYLMIHIEAHARSLGLTELQLAASPQALGFYYKNGWRKVQDIEIEHNGVKFAETLMGKQIELQGGAIQEFQDLVRIQINRYIFSNGFAPEAADLADVLKTKERPIIDALRQLADNHALVLHPNSSKIWVAHPFALFPTLFWVECRHRKWWGNCIWCSLGIASMCEDNVRIHTKLAGEAAPVVIEIINGAVVQKDLYVHFPIPAKQLWNNVLYSCANMLVFEDREAVRSWCERHNIAMGEVIPIEQVWHLAKIWYGNYLDDSWTRKTPGYAQSLFTAAGLTGEFWKLT